MYIPLMDREDVAVHPEELLPLNADLSRLIVYDTSRNHRPFHCGASPSQGHGPIPAHDRIRSEQYGIRPDFGPELVAFFNITAMSKTVTFPNVFSVWNQSGFAKVNLNPADWPGGANRARRFFADLAPLFLAGDPVGLAEMIPWKYRPNQPSSFPPPWPLGPKLKAELAGHFQCPIIDWYSTTETGPIAFSCSEGFLHILPHDIFVETITPEGDPAPSGEPGEITVTGGRNPYLPLLRFKTGDHARLVHEPCPCGDPMPRLIDLEGRSLVAFRAANGSVISQVDISLIMRQSLFLQHEFIQRADRSIDVRLRPVPGYPVDISGVAKRLQTIFGPKISIRVVEDDNLGLEAKVIPFSSELED